MLVKIPGRVGCQSFPAFSGSGVETLVLEKRCDRHRWKLLDGGGRMFVEGQDGNLQVDGRVRDRLMGQSRHGVGRMMPGSGMVFDFEIEFCQA
jgi:hypothetical protein